MIDRRNQPQQQQHDDPGLTYDANSGSMSGGSNSSPGGSQVAKIIPQKKNSSFMWTIFMVALPVFISVMVIILWLNPVNGNKYIQDLDGLSAQMTNLKNLVTTIQTTTDTNKTDITKINGSITAIQSNITTLQADVKTLKDNPAIPKSTIDNMNAVISDLKTQITNLPKATIDPKVLDEINKQISDANVAFTSFADSIGERVGKLEAAVPSATATPTPTPTSTATQSNVTWSLISPYTFNQSPTITFNQINPPALSSSQQVVLSINNNAGKTINSIAITFVIAIMNDSSFSTINGTGLPVGYDVTVNSPDLSIFWSKQSGTPPGYYAFSGGGSTIFGSPLNQQIGTRQYPINVTITNASGITQPFYLYCKVSNISYQQ